MTGPHCDLCAVPRGRKHHLWCYRVWGEMIPSWFWWGLFIVGLLISVLIGER